MSLTIDYKSACTILVGNNRDSRVWINELNPLHKGRSKSKFSNVNSMYGHSTWDCLNWRASYLWGLSPNSKYFCLTWASKRETFFNALIFLNVSYLLLSLNSASRSDSWLSIIVNFSFDFLLSAGPLEIMWPLRTACMSSQSVKLSTSPVSLVFVYKSVLLDRQEQNSLSFSKVLFRHQLNSPRLWFNLSFNETGAWSDMRILW